MDDKKKNHIRSSYINYLQKMPVKNGTIECWTNDENEMFSLVRQIRKDKILGSYLTGSEVIWKLHSIPYEFSKSKKPVSDGVLKDLYPREDCEEMAQQLISFLEGIPYEHTFYIKLPFSLPEKVDVVPLGNGTQIIRMDENEKQTIGIKNEGGIGGLFFSNPLWDAHPDGAYFKTKAFGYGDNAQAKALRVFKRFAYLCSATGFMPSQKYERTGGSGIANLYSACSALGQPRAISLPSDIVNYISGIKLNEAEFTGYESSPQNSVATLLGGGYKTYEEFYESKFTWGCRTFTKIQGKEESADHEHIMSAIEWGFDGSANTNETMGFIQVCIGLEALLGDKNGGGQKSLTDKLADRCAYLLGKTPSERKGFADKFKDLYDLRCELVHGVRPQIAEEHSAQALAAEVLLRQLIFKEIWLA